MISPPERMDYLLNIKTAVLETEPRPQHFQTLLAVAKKPA